MTMKLIFAIVQSDDTRRLIKALIKHNISCTRISSTGGFLSGGNSTLMIGVENSRLEETLGVIKEKSSVRKEYMVIPTTMHGFADAKSAPVPVMLGGATVFVVDAEGFYKF